MFPRDIVCLRNMSINTLHKGDDDDNNNNRTYEKMKTQAILIAAVALLLGTEAALIQPAPRTSVALNRPGMNSRKVLPNFGNYLSYKNSGHTGDFNNLQFCLKLNNVLNFQPHFNSPGHSSAL